ncbi:hypothetical protein KW789_01270 [Candidatus Saccharibacteria bacterium]|nr:hypothetical protein [Candidatus Saccharibacteria bacterium]
MHILRRSLLVIITPLFTALLFAAALDWGIVKTIGHPSAVKQIVAESGIYDTVIPNLLSQSKQITSSVGIIPLTDPGIQQAANQVFSPAYVARQSDTIIDSIYAWLDGKTAQPEFKIDLSGPKADFANTVAGQVQQRVSSLPKCTTRTSATTFDVYNATCLPVGVTPIAVAKTTHDSILSGQGFLNNQVISAASVSSNGSNQSVFANQLKGAPAQYQRAKKTPIILILLTIIVATGIVLLSTSHLKGLKHVGITLLLVGLLMLVFSWGLNKAVATQIAPKISNLNGVNPAIKDKLKVVITDISQRIDKNYWAFGGIYTVLGAVALAAPMIIRPKIKGHLPTPAETTGGYHTLHASEAIPTHQSAAASPPQKTRIKIQ